MACGEFVCHQSDFFILLFIRVASAQVGGSKGNTMEFVNFVLGFVEAMSWPERISIATGLIYIVLSVRQKPLCWPFGILSVGIWMVVVFNGRLYMDAFLQFVYVVLGFYGWWQWMRGGENDTPLPVRTVDKALALKLTGIGIVGIIIFGYISQNILHAAFPWLDTITTVISLIAQYLLARKYLENWILWIVADAMYIYIYFAKGWTGYSGLMAVYTIMAVAGLYSWYKSMQADAVNADAKCQTA
jgi:nicotinamide mononucleotide transporter